MVKHYIIIKKKNEKTKVQLEQYKTILKDLRK